MALRTLVIFRAQESCEYCLVHADYDAVLVHEIDHLIAEKHGGATEADNLAYACAQCNRFKGSDIATFDPQTGQIVPLFNPHTQSWQDHFRHDGAVVIALSPFGKTISTGWTWSGMPCRRTRSMRHKRRRVLGGGHGR
jgi:hypothetical protein